MATAKLDEELEGMDGEELRQILLQLDALANQERSDNTITNDDELHAWIVEHLKINVPRVAVCDDHDPPFAIVADLFFGRVDAAILVAGRGGGKTMTAALWQALNMRFFPEVECASVAAVEIQAKRAYQHFKHFQRIGNADQVDQSLISETVWLNGSKYEILTGSISSVNGPHPQRVHRDEVELMDKKVFQESLQMEKSKRTSDGTLLPSQTLITSTRKTSDGLMQELLDSCKEAEKEGLTPPYKVYTYCIKDVTENVPNCRVANPDIPEYQKCECHLAKNGVFDDDQPRTLEIVCGGAFARSQGFMPLEDVRKTFMKSSKHIWEAQQECKRPYVEDITLPEFSRQKHGIVEFKLDPSNGPIYQGIDFGGTNPHAVEWIQVLDYEVEVTGYNGNTKRLPEGTRVMFCEIYIANVGNVKLADLIVDTEKRFKKENPKFRVQGRFADPQAKAARLDFKDHDPPLLCKWPIMTRDREEHVKNARDLLIDGLFAVDVRECEMFVEEIEAWNIANKKFDHAVDAGLYGISNVYAVEKDRKRHNVTDTPTGREKKMGYGPNQFNDAIPSGNRNPFNSGRPLTAADKWL